VSCRKTSAGAFVKFLIEKYGKGKFLQIYQTLKNSDDKIVHQQNIKKIICVLIVAAKDSADIY